MKINFNLNKKWDKNIAIKIAIKEKILLYESHFTIIMYLRDFYIKYKISPEINLFISFIKKKYGEKIGNIKYINLLFNKKINLIYKISGIPFPKKCII